MLVIQSVKGSFFGTWYSGLRSAWLAVKKEKNGHEAGKSTDTLEPARQPGPTRMTWNLCWALSASSSPHLMGCVRNLQQKPVPFLMRSWRSWRRRSITRISNMLFLQCVNPCTSLKQTQFSQEKFIYSCHHLTINQNTYSF